MRPPKNKTKLFQTNFKKPLDKETKVNYNKDNETKSHHKKCEKYAVPLCFVSLSSGLVLFCFADTQHYNTKPNKSQVKGVILLDKYFTCEEIAERYGVKVATVWDWIRQKKLPAISIGKIYRIKESDLLEFEQSNKTTNADSKE